MSELSGRERRFARWAPRRPHPLSVLLTGEAGVGKSRLVQELSERAQRDGARVLAGVCAEFGGEGIPFGPVADVIRTLADELEPDELNELLGPARSSIPPAAATPSATRSPAMRCTTSFCRASARGCTAPTPRRSSAARRSPVLR